MPPVIYAGTPLDNRLTTLVAAIKTKFDQLYAFMANVLSTDYYVAASGIDDTVTLQAAFNSGKKVRLLSSSATYLISSSLTAGNGSAAALSTINGIQIEGSTSGAALSEFAPVAFPTRIKWIGAAGGTMLIVNGPIVGFNQKGIVWDCNGIAATAVQCNHMLASTWQDILMVKYTGTAEIHEAYPVIPGHLVNGAQKNTFINVRAKNPASGGSGIRVGVTSGFVAGMLDVAQNIWINCEWYRDGTDATTFSIRLAFCDNCTFIESTPSAQGGTSGVSVWVKPPTGATGAAAFPQEIAFLNCPILGGFTVDVGWAPVSPIVCFPFPTSDGEPLPSSQFISGMTFNGQWFGHQAYALKSSSAPVSIGDLTLEATSNTSLTFHYRGLDNTIRSASLALS